jgi:hypothetical protein
MDYLTHEQFLERVEKSQSRYWREGASYRWKYMERAIFHMQRLGAEKIIEAGASGMPLCHGSFLFDFPKYDLNITPYGFEDKSFDVFVALQVWEHLDNQPQAFAEVMRISRAAVLSIPYMWTHGDARHRGIDDKKIAEWTLGEKPEIIETIGSRKLYVWQF